MHSCTHSQSFLSALHRGFGVGTLPFRQLYASFMHVTTMQEENIAEGEGKADPVH